MARICVVRAFFVPEDVRVRREINALADAGHRVTVICMRSPGSVRRERYGDVEIHRLPMTHRRGGILRYAFEYWPSPCWPRCTWACSISAVGSTWSR